MPPRKPFDETELRRLIESEKLTQIEVARRMGASRSWVARTCRRLGLETQRTGPRSGAGHPCWTGGRRIVGGYRYLYRPDHPRATKQGYVLEHRLAMEAHLGRSLEPHEVVHHRDGDRLNNDLSNLAVFATNADHLRHELTGRVPNWTQEGKRRIAEGVQRARSLRLSGRDAQGST